ncbi:MAG TPA: hypothetical protein VKW78_17115 [Terriglobales bacterium]|nr:hypothetical protein [Terriglobales bacterium]
MKTPRTFLYQAHGFAISGVIFRPDEEHIPTQGMATLATTGGTATATVDEPFSYKDIVSFKRSDTVITGTSPKKNLHVTDMKVTIEGLNIMNRFTADKVVTHIRCTHTLGDFGKENRDRSEIVPGDSEIIGAKVDDEPLTVNLDNKNLLKRYSNYTRLREAYKKASFRDEVQQRFHWIPGKTKRKIPPPVQTRYKWAERLRKKLPEHGHILCSLVDEIQSPNLGDYIFGNMIVLPDFGAIYLGDYFVDKHAARLEMVRVEIAKPFYGMICDGGGGNGSGYPPAGG